MITICEKAGTPVSCVGLGVAVAVGAGDSVGKMGVEVCCGDEGLVSCVVTLGSSVAITGDCSFAGAHPTRKINPSASAQGNSFKMIILFFIELPLCFFVPSMLAPQRDEGYRYVILVLELAGSFLPDLQDLVAAPANWYDQACFFIELIKKWLGDLRS